MTDVDKPSPKGVAASGSRLFARDVGRALVVWARDPRLPVAAMAIAMLSAVPLAIDATIGPSGIGLVSFVVFGALAGFYGTERVWFVFVDRGLPFTWREFRVLNGRLRSRYIRLGVLAVCLFVVPAVPISVLAHNGTTAEITATSIVVVLFDIAFTFATIGLAFNDGTAREALRHSLHVLRVEWPRCAWYALAPPVAIQFVIQVLPRSSLTLPSRLLLDLAVAAFALLCKGATVLFYADRYPTLDGST